MRRAMGILATALVTFGVTDAAGARGFGGTRFGGGGLARGGFAGGGEFARGGIGGGGFGGGGFAGGPFGGVAAGGSLGGFERGPAGGFRAGGAQTGEYVGPRGTTVDYGRAGGAGGGPLGGYYAGGARGAKITTPSDRTFYEGEHGGVAAGPFGGVAVGGGRGAAVSGPDGSAAIGRRGGVAVGPAGAVVAGGARGGAAAGAWGGGAVWGHSTGYVSPGWLGGRGAYVRDNFRYDCFRPGWYAAHPGAWFAAGWGAATAWNAPAWSAFGPWFGVTAAPIAYDYGTTAVIHDDTVYVEGEPVASAEDYAGQATAIADQGRRGDASPDDEWQPLGVFGMIQGDEQVAQHIFQLAVNKSGVVRGNYYDAVADNTLPVYGSVDKESQRVAWSIGEKKTIVFEAGLVNLTKEQTTILVHYGRDDTRQMVLVRLERPDAADRSSP